MIFYDKKVKEFRLNKRIKLKTICEKLKIERTTYWAWENGRRVPKESYVRDIAAILEVNVSEISSLQTINKKSNKELTEAAQAVNKVKELKYLEVDKNAKQIKNIIDRMSSEIMKSSFIVNTILNYLNVPFYIKNVDQAYIVGNDAFLQLTRFKNLQTINKKSDFDLFLRKTAKKNFEFDKKLIKSSGIKICYEDFIPGTGNKRWGIIEKQKIFDENGAIIGIIGSFIDITEKVILEKLLKASEHKYKTLLENIPHKIYLKDVNSNYISCNKNYAADLGILPDKIKGKNDFDFHPKEIAIKYRDDDKYVVKEGKIISIVEEYYEGDKIVKIKTIKSPVKNEDGDIVGIIGLFHEYDNMYDNKRIHKLKSAADKCFTFN